MQTKKLKFTKMHGCGNDYIYFNCFEQQIENPEALSIRLSDRHFGVGGDGVILICPSDKADARMRMFNADGSEGKMCGNGTRCIGKYIYERGIAKKPVVTLETLSGIKTLALTVEEDVVTAVQVDMGAPILEPEKIPIKLKGDRAVNVEHMLAGKLQKFTCISMGNPHCVIFTENIDALDLEKIGPAYENDPIFPEKVNTEFVEVIDEHTLKMRVWERGSGETLACGTGACATAVAAVLCGYCKMDTDITLKLRGGDLLIRYTGETVLMTGPATVVFEGEVLA
ncbi:diaminopimelate epimerase [Oscillospiraceae bacterium LTW-04]|nr:diaminopimelate epimerase [Oscillospiraceae bacterium MB24-C1]